MYRVRMIFLAVILIVVVSVAQYLIQCSAGANPLKGVPRGDGVVTGFLCGLWQGAILPVAFVISLFKPTVGIYEVHNNGAWYNFGFVLGAVVVLAGFGFVVAAVLGGEEKEEEEEKAPPHCPRLPD